MRNISIVQDQLLSLDLHNGRIVSIAVNHTNHKLYVLTSTGVLATYDISDGIKILAQTQLFFENTQETWFAIDFLMVGSTLVALSREGSIVTADENGESQSGELENLDQIGVIDGGIRSASWSPDYSSLAIVTGNNTLLLMSNTWEPISEIDLPPITSGSSLDVSWKGDGELLSIASQDAADQCYYARIYTKTLQLHAVGRNVADGPAGILKGVGSSIAFAPNGTLVAIYQRKAAELPQVAFLEKNGLRHGDFDLRKPPLPNDLTIGDWDVSHLAWDMTSTVMAVSWSAPIVSQPNSPSSTWGCIQLYYRENYYWYLKQQWTGPTMTFLTFDNEVHGRLYISQSADTASSLRIVDTFWKISSSPCRDGTVSVTDGVTQHFTPLGYNNVPPPMSMFQEKWSNNQLATQACARNVTFWPFPVGSTQEKSNSASKFLWGAAFLLNEDGLVAFVLGDQRGKISSAGYLRIPNHQRCALREIAMLDLSSSPSVDIQKEKLALVAIGSPVQQVSSNPNSKVHHHEDVMMVLHIDVTTLVQAVARSNAAEPIDFSHYYAIAQLPGSIYTMTSIVGEEHALAVGIKHKETGSFDVHRLDFAAAFIELAGVEALPEHASLDFCDFPTELLLTIPEVCPHMYVLVNSKNSSSYYSHTVISLSLRNRLYVGEVLLVPGASSFAFNHAFNMLMFITVGTKPMLHFVTYGTLLKINPLMGEDQQELFEAAEPRPVERGAKLVASIENDSKLIIQLPRGNLETFEPRPLIILRAQQLINQCKLIDCLILLRLQRIDLNYLVDFDPTIFFEELERFIPQAIEKKADLLSLFITSLEPVDVTVTKYQLFDESSAENRTRRRMFVDKSQFLDKTKINVTCERLRAGLHTYLQQLQSQEKQLTAQQNSTVTNAILCTFAKQQPPLLVDALHFIQSHHQLNKSMQQASIKYLVFLVDGTQLFDAAVGDCVFDLARAVARQCQMDPKVYLPLLEKFESIGRGHAKNSLPFTLMHLNVQHHLSRAWETVEDFVSLLRLLYQSETSGDSVPIVSQEQVETALQLAEEMMLSSTVSSSSGANSNPPQSELMVKLLPQLVQLEQLMEEELLTTSTQSKFHSISVAKRFITSTRKHYAQHCLQQMQYHMAIASFLACYPPLPQRAIDSASAAGDWQQAIFLANRFHQASSSAVVAPMKLIQDIVNNFKQNQDTVSTSQSLEMTALTVTQAITSAESVSVLKSALASSNSSIVGNKEGAEENRAVTAARLCVEYLQDVESAVTILVTAQQWTLAMDYAGRFQRRDLYDEIYLAAHDAAEDVIATLDEKCALFPTAASGLKELWSVKTSATEAQLEEREEEEEKPVVLDRLHHVAQHDRLLQRILDRIEQGDDYDDAVNQSNANANDSASVIQDNASDFSAASKYSLLSLRSARSAQSGVSVQSSQSRASQYSMASATSTSNTSTANQNFSIQGLEHTLLSRGIVDPNAPPPNTGANKPFHGEKKKPMSKGERRRKKAAEEVEELRRERERALLDGDGGNASNTAGGTGEESDYTRRKNRRQERQRYRAQEKNKDEVGLKPESDHCDCLWQAAVTVPLLSQMVQELCHLFSINHSNDVHDHLLAIRLQSSMSAYVQALQAALQIIPPAPEYPLPWLQQRNMPSVQFFQDVRLLYQGILQLRLRGLNSSTTTSAVTGGNMLSVRTEDMAILRRYEYDIWHVLQYSLQSWSKVKMLLLQQTAV